MNDLIIACIMLLNQNLTPVPPAPWTPMGWVVRADKQALIRYYKRPGQLGVQLPSGCEWVQ